MKTIPLRYIADVRSSSVDKLSNDGEQAVRLCNYTDVYGNDCVNPSLNLMQATATSEEVARFRLEVGDSVITKDSEDPQDIGISAFVDATANDLVCGYHLAVIRPDSVIHPRYFNWSLRSREVLGHWSSQASGMTRYGLGLGGIKSAPIHVPALGEQRRIADLLDDRVARIDRIIAARREQVTLWDEQFRAGLQECMWVVRKSMPLKHLVVDVTSGPRGWGDLVALSGTTPFVRIGNLSPLGIELIRRELVRVDVPEDAEGFRAALAPGDVLLSITAAFGQVAVWRGGAGAFSQHVARLRPKSDDDSDWIAWVLQTRSVHDQYRLQAYGGTKIGMGLDQVRNLEVPAQTSTQRMAAVEALSKLWSAFSVGRSALTRSIKLLTEYKSSLITAAVTGELDVTTAGSRIPG